MEAINVGLENEQNTISKIKLKLNEHLYVRDSQ